MSDRRGTRSTAKSTRTKRQRTEEPETEQPEETNTTQEEVEEPEETSSSPPTPEASAPKSSFTTPHVSSFSSSATPRMTPTRMARVEEKIQLQELNKRLEFYILRQRERDASLGGAQRELDIVKDNTEREVETIKRTYETQIHNVRQSRDEQAAENAQLQEQTSRQASLIKQLSNQLMAEQKKSSDLEELNRSLNADNQSLRSKLFSADELCKSLTHDLELERNSNEQLKEDLEKVRAVADHASSRLAGLESTARNLKEDNDLLLKRHEHEVTELNRQLEQLSGSRAAIEDELRKIFAQQLTEILAERQQQYEDEKNAGMAELKTLYDEKISAYRESLEHLASELEETKQKCAELEVRAMTTTGGISDAEMAREIFEKKIHELETKLGEMGENHLKTMAEKSRMIQHLQKSFQQKDEDFDALMDVKIALAMEIKAYRMLLENEEDRLGYRAPSNKKASNDFTGSLYISKMDIEGSQFVIRNGSTEPISLEGWSIRSQNTEDEFKFPGNITVPSGAIFTVWCGPDAKERENLPSDLAWEGDSIWDEKGDCVLLANPEGEIVAKVDIARMQEI